RNSSNSFGGTVGSWWFRSSLSSHPADPRDHPGGCVRRTANLSPDSHRGRTTLMFRGEVGPLTGPWPRTVGCTQPGRAHGPVAKHGKEASRPSVCRPTLSSLAARSSCCGAYFI